MMKFIKHILGKFSRDKTIMEDREITPVFVYGTLRPGQGNYSWALAGKTLTENEGALESASMYSNGGFPYVLHDENMETEVTGTLIDVQPEHLDDVMDSLDMLEGTNHGPENDMNHYNRYKLPIRVAPKHYVYAWAYIPPRSDYKRIRSNNRHVISGDWLAR